MGKTMISFFLLIFFGKIFPDRVKLLKGLTIRNDSNNPEIDTVKMIQIEFFSEVILEINQPLFIFCDSSTATNALSRYSNLHYIPSAISNRLNQNFPYRKLELETVGHLFFLVVMNETNPSIAEAIAHIRDFGGKGAIISFSDPSNESFSDHASSDYFQVFIARFSGAGYIIYEKCAYCDKGKNYMKEINRWSDVSGFRKRFNLPRSFKRNMNNATIPVAWVNYGAFKTQEIDDEGNKLPESFEHEMLGDVADMMKFNFVMIVAKDKEGGVFKNGEWTGKMGLLVSKKADIAIEIIQISHDRFRFVDPTAILDRKEIGLLSAKPISNSLRWTIMFEAFTLIVWIGTVLSGLFTGLVLYLIKMYSPEDSHISLSEAVVLPFIVLSSEPIVVNKPSSGTILILSVWLLMSFLVVSFYSGSITSLTLTPAYTEEPINTATDLSKSGRYWWVKKGSGNDIAFENFPELYPFKLHWKVNETMFDVLSLIKSEPDKYVLLNDLTSTPLQAIQYFYEEDGRNPFHFSHKIYATFLNTWLVRKTCPFTEELTLSLMKLIESGLDKYYKRKHFRKQRKNVEKFGKNVVDKPAIKITIKHFWNMIIVFIFGYASAIVVFIAEVFHPFFYIFRGYVVSNYCAIREYAKKKYTNLKRNIKQRRTPQH